VDISYILRTVDDPLIQPCSDSVAISFEDQKSITYGELLVKTRAAMGGLESQGVKCGDRIALLAYNSIDYWILYFAITGLGAIIVKLNWRLTSEEIDYAITDCGASVVFVSPELSGSVGFLCHRPEIYIVSMADHFALDSGRTPDATLADILAGEPRDFPSTTWPPSTPAVIMYTSGTTGRPKGAVWTHSNAISYACMQALHWGIDRNTKALTTGPFYHVGAFENLLTATLLMKGTAVFTQSTGFSIERTANVMASLKIDCALLYPFMIGDLVALNPDLLGRLGNLRMLVTGGSAIAPSIIRELRRLLPKVGLVQTYGLTEGGAIATASIPQDCVDFPECVGQAFELSQVKVCIDDAGTSAPIGGVGEVWIRSPSVAVGYWKRPSETAETFIDGWCRTGDLGIINSGGRLQITGRKKDMIRSGGENVYPAELEMVLKDHSAVADLAIIGVPDVKYEETVCAVIVVKDGAFIDPEEFRAYARTRLAKYKVPTHIEIVDELPRTASGKIQKFVLRERYSHLANND
jgi:fatty-acyl-CoA synthase